MRYLCAILCFAASVCFAAPGRLPDAVFRDLAGAPRHPLEPAEKDASVLVFFCQDCPISNGYIPELNRIAASHTNCAFYIVQVDPALTPALAQEHAAQYHLSLPVLLDPKHQLVKLARATVTPEAVVFGKNGDVLYRGCIDDNYAAYGKKRASARQHDLVDALDAIATGQPVKLKETNPIGCVIE